MATRFCLGAASLLNFGKAIIMIKIRQGLGGQRWEITEKNGIYFVYLLVKSVKTS